MTTKQTTWIVELEEDPETGDLVMPFPPGLMEELGWKIGDTLTWESGNDSGSYRLTKKTDQVQVSLYFCMALARATASLTAT